MRPLYQNLLCQCASNIWCKFRSIGTSESLYETFLCPDAGWVCLPALLREKKKLQWKRFLNHSLSLNDVTILDYAKLRIFLWLCWKTVVICIFNYTSFYFLLSREDNCTKSICFISLVGFVALIPFLLVFSAVLQFSMPKTECSTPVKFHQHYIQCTRRNDAVFWLQNVFITFYNSPASLLL